MKNAVKKRTMGILGLGVFGLSLLSMAAAPASASLETDGFAVASKVSEESGTPGSQPVQSAIVGSERAVASYKQAQAKAEADAEGRLMTCSSGNFRLTPELIQQSERNLAQFKVAISGMDADEYTKMEYNDQKIAIVVEYEDESMQVIKGVANADSIGANTYAWVFEGWDNQFVTGFNCSGTPSEGGSHVG